jgi:hypothetical protein
MDSDGLQVLDDSFMERGAKIGEYGKSLNSFLTADDMTLRTNDDNYPHYITQRILITDLNKDGNNEIVVVENDEGATSFITRLRAFKWGKVLIFSWDAQQGLVKTWESETYSGGILDIHCGDVTGNGKNELVYAINSSAKNMVNIGSSQQSYIIVKGF